MMISPDTLLAELSGGHPDLGVCSHSEEVRAGDIFIAQGEGSQYIQRALDKGALRAVCQRGERPAAMADSDNVVEVDDLDSFIDGLLQQVYGLRISKVDLIGITGTNGKTSTAYFCSQLFNFLGVRSGYIGTLGYGVVEEGLVSSRNTTPDRISLYRYIAELAQSGCRKIILEVSSHALVLGRIRGLEFETGVFTNLSRDHLDFHGNMQAYEDAKLSFFTDYIMKNHLVNIDDVVGRKLYERQLKSHKGIVAGYSQEPGHGEIAYRYWFDDEANMICINHLNDIYRIPVSFRGQFNIENMLVAVLLCHLSGYSLSELAEAACKVRAVPGRLQCVQSSSGHSVCIDYAHTPAAMASVLKDSTLLPGRSNSVWCVFGCGGDRDAGKRPAMAKIAQMYADYAVVVDDNVREEPAEKILCDVVSGFSSKAGLAICRDRRQAMGYVLHTASADDVVFLLGKGDEDVIDYGQDKISQRDIDLVQQGDLL